METQPTTPDQQMTPPSHPVALVTGGGSGIGRGIARALAKQGYDLALVGRRSTLLGAVASELGKTGVRALALPIDLTNSAARETVLPRVRAALGPPTLLVHGAGMLAGGDLSTLTATQIEQAVTLNLTVPLSLTQAAIPDLITTKGGVILLASLAADLPLPAATLYSATKAGIAAFGESLRHEVGPQGVRVLIAYPPNTATAMTQGMAQAAGFPRYRLADPDSVGAAIVTALLSGQRNWHGSSSERALTLAHQLAPRLTRPLVRSQRGRIRRMMTAPKDRTPQGEE